MGPCVRRDGLLRDCTRPRPINVPLNSAICDSPPPQGGREQICQRFNGAITSIAPFTIASSSFRGTRARARIAMV
jgi:hypothetical protein